MYCLIGNYVEISTAQKEIRHSEPAPPVAEIPNGIALDSTLGGVTFLTGYTEPFKNIYRAGANSNITISGVATKDGVPLANTEIVVGVLHWAWEGWTAANFDRYTIVTTDANGRFTGTVRTAHGHALNHPTTYEVHNGVSIHILEEATIYAQSITDPNVLTSKNIYILAGTR